MRLKLLFIVFLGLTVLAGCADKNKSFTGEFCDIKAKTDASYAKDYIMMSCCEGWPELRAFVMELYDNKALNYAEGYEFYLYDENGEPVSCKNGVEVTIHPTNDFKDKPCDDVCVYSLSSKSRYEVKALDNGDLVFNANEDGMFIAVKSNKSANLWISDDSDDCNGQCRSCSDEW